MRALTPAFMQAYAFDAYASLDHGIAKSELSIELKCASMHGECSRFPRGLILLVYDTERYSVARKP